MLRQIDILTPICRILVAENRYSYLCKTREPDGSLGLVSGCN